MTVHATFSNQLNHDASRNHGVFYSPSSIAAIFNAAIQTKEEKKLIHIKGIFQKSGTMSYGGRFYDRLKDEAGENSITLITTDLIRNQLGNNKTIEFTGYITRRIDNQGQIALQANVIELLAQQVNKFSDEEIKAIELINKKIEIGFKDFDGLVKKAIVEGRRLKVRIVVGNSAIIHSDIAKAMETTVCYFDIEYCRVSLTAPRDIIAKIVQLDADPKTDIICIARGGGDNLQVFDTLDLCECILQRNTVIASAIGHAQDITLFEKLADKKFITPTQFGNYLKEIYNSTIADLANSKAKLADDIKRQLDTYYGKQVQNLNDQLKLQKESAEKNLEGIKIMYSEQLSVVTNKLRSFEELASKTAQQKNDLNKTEISTLQKHVNELQRQHSQKVI